MLLMVGKGNRGGICHAIHRYATETNKYMKNYNKDNKSSDIMYLDPNNLYGWAISQKLPVNDFEWEKMSKRNKKFIKSYDENSDKGYIPKAYVKNLKQLHNRHNDLPFLPEKMEITKCNKYVCNFLIKKQLCCTYENFKTSIKSWINTKKMHNVIQSNQKAWLKSYIDINAKLRTEVKNGFERDFFKLMKM